MVARRPSNVMVNVPVSTLLANAERMLQEGEAKFTQELSEYETAMQEWRINAATACVLESIRIKDGGEVDTGNYSRSRTTLYVEVPRIPDKPDFDVEDIRHDIALLKATSDETLQVGYSGGSSRIMWGSPWVKYLSA